MGVEDCITRAKDSFGVRFLHVVHLPAQVSASEHVLLHKFGKILKFSQQVAAYSRLHASYCTEVDAQSPQSSRNGEQNGATVGSEERYALVLLTAGRNRRRLEFFIFDRRLTLSFNVQGHKPEHGNYYYCSLGDHHIYSKVPD